MSQTTTSAFPKLSIKQKDPNGPLTAANAQVSLDGKPIGGITFLKLELKPGRIAKVKIELVASLDDFEATIGDMDISRHIPESF